MNSRENYLESCKEVHKIREKGKYKRKQLINKINKLIKKES